MLADQAKLTGLDTEVEAAPLPGQRDLFALLEETCGQGRGEVRSARVVTFMQEGA